MDIEKYQKQFDLVFKSKIEPQIKELEEKRQQINKILYVYMLLFLVGMGLFYLLYKTSNVTFGLTFLFCILLSITFFVIYKKQKAYRLELKNKLLMNILSVFGRFRYVKEPIIKLPDLQRYGLFADAEYKTDDDIIVGKYKDLDVAINEMNIFKYEKKNGESTKNCVFSGLLLKIKMNKNFSGTTVIRQKPMSYEQLLRNIKIVNQKNNGIIPSKLMSILTSPVFKFAFSQKEIMGQKISFDTKGISFTDKKSGSKTIKLTQDGISMQSKYSRMDKNLEEVTLEDSDFNECFDVYSDEQVEARYLITPTFIERFKNLSTVVFVLNTYCIFDKGNIYLLLGNPITSFLDGSSNFFEFDLKPGQTLYDKEIYDKIFRDLIMIFEFIYYFKLDQKIGL